MRNSPLFSSHDHEETLMKHLRLFVLAALSTPLAAAAAGKGTTTTFAVSAALLFRPLGANGIALSNSIAFTLEAVILLLLLRRAFPSVGRVRPSVLRAVAGAAAGCAAALVVWALVPSAGFLAATLALAVGGAVVLPFVLPELKELAAL